MNITDNPMPGVAPNGTPSLMAIGTKGKDIFVLSTYLKDVDFAKRWARSMAAEYDEVIILDTIILYRVWDKDSENGRKVISENKA